MYRAVLYTLLAVAAYACAVVVVNRWSEPKSGPLTVATASGLAPAGDSISVLTWNLGYAGLGAESDFVVDGGTHYLPPSRAAVTLNLRGIGAQLARLDADLFLLQEIAVDSPLNYWVDVRAGIEPRFRGFASIFEPDVATSLLPPPLRVMHGTAIYSRIRIGAAEKRILALENDRIAGLLRREYRMQIARLPIDGTTREWVIVNIHLAAFDENAAIRRRQFGEVMRFAVAEFESGNHVVIGGDWNMEFAKDRFPHTTADRYLFWLHDFPHRDLPARWRAVFDPSVPTARTVHQPYKAGENYVTIIDGFVVSPNVEAVSVAASDTRFLYSDHQPVVARFRRR